LGLSPSSGVSHHPSPAQPASESAACELPGEISHLDVQQGGSLGYPLQIDMAKRMGRKLTENSSLGKIGMEWKKMTVGRTVYLINQNQNPTNSTWDVPTATGEINPMVEFLPTQTLVVLLRRSLSCWNFSDGLFRWILGANRLTQHQK
jgi:hypothetical protein